MRHVHPPTSAHVDISVAENASFNEAFQFDDPSVTTWDFANKEFRMDLKGNYEQAGPLLSMFFGATDVADIATRVLHMNVPDSVFQNVLVPGEYVYDLIMTDELAVRTQLMHGKFTWARGVTGG